jgi:hypothetical protein
VFVVDIKPSARRANGAVGGTVNRRGTRRRFEAREDAESWAAGLTQQGERRVWIRRANPDDGTGADAYLVSRRPRRGTDLLLGGSRVGDLRRVAASDQAGLAGFDAANDD